jgi:hypothetical protein
VDYTSRDSTARCTFRAFSRSPDRTRIQVQERHRPQHPIILCSPVAHGWVRCLRREAGDLRSIAASRQLQIQALHPRTFLPCKMNSAL